MCFSSARASLAKVLRQKMHIRELEGSMPALRYEGGLEHGILACINWVKGEKVSGSRRSGLCDSFSSSLRCCAGRKHVFLSNTSMHLGLAPVFMTLMRFPVKTWWCCWIWLVSGSTHVITIWQESYTSIIFHLVYDMSARTLPMRHMQFEFGATVNFLDELTMHDLFGNVFLRSLNDDLAFPSFSKSRVWSKVGESTSFGVVWHGL